MMVIEMAYGNKFRMTANSSLIQIILKIMMQQEINMYQIEHKLIQFRKN